MKSMLAVLLVAGAVAAPWSMSGSALGDLTGGGSMPSVPEPPEPTRVDNDDDREPPARPPPREPRPPRPRPGYNPNPAPPPAPTGPTLEELRQEQLRLEQQRLERERQEQENLEREREEMERVERERIERARLERERLERERVERERVERERQQFLFDLKKQNLADAFRLAPLPTTAGPHATAAGDRPRLSNDSSPTGMWRRLAVAQAEVDELEARAPKLTAAERNKLGQAILRRNLLWRTAVSDPVLTAEERDRLKLRLGIDMRGTVGYETAAPLRLTDAPPRALAEPTAPVIQTMLATMNTTNLVNWVEYRGNQIVEAIGGEDAVGRYEKALGAAKIVLRTAKDGRAAGMAEGLDFVISSLEIPQAGLAVAGGRQMADVAFKAQNKFMEDAMLSVGATFDTTRFWQELRAEFSTTGQAVFEWVGAPGGNE